MVNEKEQERIELENNQRELRNLTKKRSVNTIGVNKDGTAYTEETDPRATKKGSQKGIMEDKLYKGISKQNSGEENIKLIKAAEQAAINNRLKGGDRDGPEWNR